MCFKSSFFFFKCKVLASVGEVPPPTPTIIQVLMPNISSGKTRPLGGNKETNTSEMYFLVHHVSEFKYFFLACINRMPSSFWFTLAKKHKCESLRSTTHTSVDGGYVRMINHLLFLPLFFAFGKIIQQFNESK